MTSILKKQLAGEEGSKGPCKKYPYRARVRAMRIYPLTAPLDPLLEG